MLEQIICLKYSGSEQKVKKSKSRFIYKYKYSQTLFIKILNMKAFIKIFTKDHKTLSKSVDFLKKIEKYPIFLDLSGVSYEIIYRFAPFICEYLRNFNLQTSTITNSIRKNCLIV
jgi:hypothetical protein